MPSRKPLSTPPPSSKDPTHGEIRQSKLPAPQTESPDRVTVTTADPRFTKFVPEPNEVNCHRETVWAKAAAIRDTVTARLLSGGKKVSHQGPEV